MMYHDVLRFVIAPIMGIPTYLYMAKVLTLNGEKYTYYNLGTIFITKYECIIVYTFK